MFKINKTAPAYLDLSVLNILCHHEDVVTDNLMIQTQITDCDQRTDVWSLSGADQDDLWVSLHHHHHVRDLNVMLSWWNSGEVTMNDARVISSSLSLLLLCPSAGPAVSPGLQCL